MPGPDYIVDIEGLRPATEQESRANTNVQPQSGAAAASGANSRGRPWIAVTWKCCSVYSRVYRNRAGTCYEGRCPKCGKPVQARVGPGGTDNRFFQAG